ncbi:MAG TPA: chemotaxis protein CheB [Myxococcaceae bacterium]|nr:chemotaxis protein CheB [Myxococcaceae bacterium]
MLYDIIAIGGSSGAIEPLQQVMAELSVNLPAAVFVVVHTAPDRPSHLQEVITRYASIRASTAMHGEKIEKGRAYVAPSDNHLSLHRDYVRVVRGPRENGQRPAVDVLFRSAAREYGPRVIGVVLSGQLDCGTAGLLAIRARGGLAIVQDPAEATFPGMPSNALRHVQVDHILPAKEIGKLLARLAGAQVPDARAKQAVGGSRLLEQQSRLQREIKEVMRADDPGHALEVAEEDLRISPVTCPECNGSMIEFDEEGLPRFRCHVGHMFSIDSLAAEQEQAVEAALWASVRALEESETVNRRRAERSERSIAERFRERAQANRHHADTIRRVLLSGKVSQESEEGAEDGAK